MGFSGRTRLHWVSNMRIVNWIAGRTVPWPCRHRELRNGGWALTQQACRKMWIIPRRFVPDGKGRHFSSRSADSTYIQPQSSPAGSPASGGNNEHDISTPCLFFLITLLSFFSSRVSPSFPCHISFSFSLFAFNMSHTFEEERCPQLTNQCT